MHYDVHTEWVAIIYFLSGLAIGTIPILHFTASKQTTINRKIIARFNNRSGKVFLFIIAIFTCLTAQNIMSHYAIDFHIADMLPQIKAMCSRLFHGEQIYAPIQEIWNGKQPPYLPLMWLPFAPAEYLGLDVRWTTTLFILLGIYFTYRILPKRYAGNPFILLIAFISLFSLINFLLVIDQLTIARTEEGVVIGYYLFLAYALTTRKPILIGIAISCCLLSRFSLFFWVPVYLVFVFFYESKKNAYIITAVIATIVLFVFLIPFGFRQPGYFMNIPTDYHVGVDNAWIANQENGKYYQHSLGYARFFDISQIALLHQLQIIVAGILPALLLILFAILKKKMRLQTFFFPICSLKITLVFFYNMVEVPYYYLFFVSTFLSYSILFFYMRECESKSVNYLNEADAEIIKNSSI